MNKVYKLVWSKTKNMYVAVSEFAKAHTKAPQSKVVSHAVAAGVLACAISIGATAPAFAEQHFTGRIEQGAGAGGTEVNWGENVDLVITDSLITDIVRDANVYSAGNGINVSNAGVISAKAGNGISVTSTGIAVKAGTNVTVDSNGVSVVGTHDVANGNTNLVTSDGVYDALNSGSMNGKFSTVTVTGNETGNGNETVTGKLTAGSVETTGEVKAGTVTVTGNETVNGTLNVTGKTTMSTLETTGEAKLKSANVTGNETVGGKLDVTGKITGG